MTILCVLYMWDRAHVFDVRCIFYAISVSFNCFSLCWLNWYFYEQRWDFVMFINRQYKFLCEDFWEISKHSNASSPVRCFVLSIEYTKPLLTFPKSWKMNHHFNGGCTNECFAITCVRHELWIFISLNCGCYSWRKKIEWTLWGDAASCRGEQGILPQWRREDAKNRSATSVAYRFALVIFSFREHNIYREHERFLELTICELLKFLTPFSKIVGYFVKLPIIYV